MQTQKKKKKTTSIKMNGDFPAMTPSVENTIQDQLKQTWHRQDTQNL